MRFFRPEAWKFTKKRRIEMPPAHVVPLQEGAARVAWSCSINVRMRVPANGSYQ